MIPATRWHDALYPLRMAAIWWFDAEWLPMPGSWTPYVLGFGLGRMPHRVK